MLPLEILLKSTYSPSLITVVHVTLTPQATDSRIITEIYSSHRMKNYMKEIFKKKIPRERNNKSERAGTN
jgi:hypothetical protein